MNQLELPMWPINISTNGDEFVYVGEPVAVNDNHYTFTRGNKVVGKIKGSFDFSELPNELHSLALQLIMGDSRRVCLALDRVPKSSIPVEKSWFEKLLTWSW